MKFLKHSSLSLLVASCFSGATAAPTLPQVVNGQATFSQQGNVFSITNTPNTIINWQSFSVNAGEITRFIQQSDSSAVLNRILGQDPSQILGALQSNGRVFLINPNGILFGRDSRVDVNGLVASTLNLSNADFLAGKKNFAAGATAGNVSNQGAITTASGGQVFLIAPNVENSGIITSPKGEVVLAAGHTVQLVDSANPDLHVVVSAPASQAINLGQVIAQGGKVGIYGALINQRGTVNANSALVGENGKIVFKASGDTLLEAGSVTIATGAGKGGEIQVLGERVGLTGNAQVDASGNAGGGTVLVGGDYQGKNPLVKNAQQVFVDKDASIKADAQHGGDGGKVVVWSDDITRAYGSISARGGEQGGNGGLVETSGKYLDMQGKVDTRAPLGNTGSLLLDPSNIYIATNQAAATAAGMAGTDVSASTGPVTFVASGVVDNSLLTVGTLQGVLGTSSVTVSTTNASGAGAGNITVVNPVAWGSGSQLTLSADNGITVNGGITAASGVLSLRAYGSGGITQSQPIAVGSMLAYADIGAVTLTNAGNSVGTLAGYTGSAASGFSFTNSGAFSVGTVAGSNGIRTNNGAPVTLTASSGNLTIANALYGVESVGGNVTLSALNGLVVESTGFVKSSGLTVTADQGIAMVNSSNQVGTLHANVTGTGTGYSIGFKNSNADLNLASSSNASPGGATVVSVGTGNNLTVSGAVSTTNGSIALTANNMTLGASINSGAGGVALQPDTAGTAVQVGASAVDGAGVLGLTATELGNITTSNTLIVNSGSGALDVYGPLNLVTPGHLTGNLSLVAGSGKVTVKAASPLTVPHYLFVYTDGTLEVDAAVSANTMLLEANKMLLNSGSISATSISLTSPAGPVTLGSATDLNAGIELSGAELGLFSTGSLSVITSGYDINVTGGSVLTPTGVSTLNLISSGNISVAPGSGLHPNTGLFLTAGAAGTITNAGTLQATDVGLTAPKMALAGGSLVGLSDVQLSAPATVHAWLGTGATDLDATALELSSSELNTVSAPLLRINAMGGKNIVVQGPLTNGAGGAFEHLTGTSTLGLYAPGGGITQASQTATIGGVNQLSLNGDWVFMDRPNPTGVVSGVTMGDFVFRSANEVSLAYVDGVHGIHAGNGGQVVLTSDNYGISQSSGNVLSVPAGRVVLNAAKGATLTDSGNQFSSIVGSLNYGTGTHAATSIYSSSDLAVATDVYADATYHGIDNGNQSIDLKVGAGTLAVNQPIITSGSGAVTLTAGAAHSPTATNIVAFEAAVTSPGGLTVNAHHISGSLKPVAGPGVTLNLFGAVVPPTLTACIANPGLSGCGSVLPTLAACISNPNADGCQVVLPDLGTCVSAPTTPGCKDVVLPTLATCISAPTTPGCKDVVLPTLPTCISAPTTPGCKDVVLPTLATCVSAPTTPGCKDVVLPTLATCVSASTTPGCKDVVLPTLATCVSAPATPGCKDVVLPTLATCMSAPTTPGCKDVVLPTLATCVSAPTTTGCKDVVLPTLATCVSTPATPGCKDVVLPTLATCVSAPTTPGCKDVVLPTLATCVSAPATPGCKDVVLPTLSTCVSTPATPGCKDVVLPTLSTCVSTPTTPGCKEAVLPTLATCVSAPTTDGCKVVLPTLTFCSSAPTTEGCKVVLPTLAQCTGSPTLQGCSVVLPTLDQCAATPTQAGCTAVLPTASFCSTHPADAACVAVSPPSAPQEGQGSTPISQAVNATVNIINTVAQTGANPPPPAATGGTGGGAGASVGAKTSDAKSDDKKTDDKKADSSTAANDKSGVKNEPSKKMYCN